ncbi:PREDICTED: two-component response regulator ARR12-like [Lupinus angustifolius]|uniref:two-component response regulator ARR12-like n=1 Tax=Lupinus angustifolius TaxID=3871 RepID=UPI00092EB773|nr:PREDICTED: two-component response regulator ARR12-like [Lupinus angustifolius]
MELLYKATTAITIVYSNIHNSLLYTHITYIVLISTNARVIPLQPSNAPVTLCISINDRFTSCIEVIVSVQLCMKVSERSFTTTDDAVAAASMICNHEVQFKIVMAKVNMPGMNNLSFFNMLHEKGIPLIYIISRDFDVNTWDLLLQGSCYFFKEPIQSKNINHVWEHLFPSKAAQNENCENKFKTTEGHVDKANRMESNNHGNTEKGCVEIREQIIAGGRKRIVWTQELHNKFTEAIAMLRYHKTSPKEIQRIMNVPGLTTAHISSHMQVLFYYFNLDMQ